MDNPRIFKIGRAIFLLMVLALITVPDSSAQVSSADGAPPVSVAQIPDVLWDQIGTAEGTAAASQNFTDPGGSFDEFDSRAADDFQIPGALGWNINMVRVIGLFQSGPGPVESVNVFFFTDDGGLPGSVIPSCEYFNIPQENPFDPNFIIDLPEPCTLTPGIYWVSVQVNLQFNPNGQWFWMSITEEVLSQFAWENPEDGFGDGCPSWTPGIDCISSVGPDLSFQLIGEPFSVPRPIPTLSNWGLIAASLILGFIGALYLTRRRTA